LKGSNTSLRARKKWQALLLMLWMVRCQTPEAVVTAAIDEDVDIIALSDHTGSMPIIAASVLAELKKRNVDDIRIMSGGLISTDDAKVLDEMGVWGNYAPGTPLDVIVEHVNALVQCK